MTRSTHTNARTRVSLSDLFGRTRREFDLHTEVVEVPDEPPLGAYWVVTESAGTVEPGWGGC